MAVEKDVVQRRREGHVRRWKSFCIGLATSQEAKEKKLIKQNQFSKTQEQGISISKLRVFLLTFHGLILWLSYVHLYSKYEVICTFID